VVLARGELLSVVPARGELLSVVPAANEVKTKVTPYVFGVELKNGIFTVEDEFSADELNTSALHMYTVKANKNQIILGKNAHSISSSDLSPEISTFRVIFTSKDDYLMCKKFLEAKQVEDWADLTEFMEKYKVFEDVILMKKKIELFYKDAVKRATDFWEEFSKLVAPDFVHFSDRIFPLHEVKKMAPSDQQKHLEKMMIGLIDQYNEDSYRGFASTETKNKFAEYFSEFLKTKYQK
jgi:hypothetical protein